MADTVIVAVAFGVIVVDPKRGGTVTQLLNCVKREFADLGSTTLIYDVVFGLMVTGIGIQQRDIDDVQKLRARTILISVFRKTTSRR